MRSSPFALALPLLLFACTSSRLNQDFAVQCGPPPVNASGGVHVEVGAAAAGSGGSLDIEPLSDTRVAGTAIRLTLITPAGEAHCAAPSGSGRVQATGDLAGVRLLIAAADSPLVRVHDPHDRELGTARFTGSAITIAWRAR